MPKSEIEPRTEGSAEIIVTFHCPRCGCTMSLDDIQCIRPYGHETEEGSEIFELWCTRGCGFVYTEKAHGTKGVFELDLIGFYRRATLNAAEAKEDGEDDC